VAELAQLATTINRVALRTLRTAFTALLERRDMRDSDVTMPSGVTSLSREAPRASASGRVYLPANPVDCGGKSLGVVIPWIPADNRHEHASELAARGPEAFPD